MTADERLARIRTKVDRANKHLDDLKVARDGFIDSTPYTRDFKIDPQSGNYLVYLTNIKSVPDPLGCIAGDAIHNLRSALDHLACHLFEVGSPGQPIPDATGFPIFKGTAINEGTFAGKVHGMRTSAKNAIRATKPYKGGTDELFRLHTLDIADKHHAPFLALVRARDAQASIPNSMFPNFKFEPGRIPRFEFTSGAWEPLKDGDVFLTCEPEVYKYIEFRFEIAFTKPEFVKSLPLIPLVQELFDFVNGLIISFYSELA